MIILKSLIPFISGGNVFLWAISSQQVYDHICSELTSVHACRAVRACVGVLFFFPPSLCPVWDLLVSDMPPSAWLLIAPGLQESRTSGTDVADGDRKHGAERSPLNTIL